MYGHDDFNYDEREKLLEFDETKEFRVSLIFDLLWNIENMSREAQFELTLYP